MILKTILLWSHLILTRELSRLYLPLPCSACAAGVDVDVDPVAKIRGRDKHMLTRVVATNDWRRNVTRVDDLKCVRATLSSFPPVRQSCCGRVWVAEDHCVKVNSDLTDIAAAFADCVDAGVGIRAC